MELMRGNVDNENHGCWCDKKVSFFIMIRRQRKSYAQDDVKLALRKQGTWCMHTYCTLFYLLKEYYKSRVLNINDLHLNLDLSQEWSEKIVEHCGTSQDFLFFTDGKPWITCRPVNGKMSTKITLQLGENNTNLV